MVQRFLKGAARQEQRKRNSARGRGPREKLPEHEEDGFEDVELRPRHLRSQRASKPKHDTARATVIAVARGLLKLSMDGQEMAAPISGALRGVAQGDGTLPAC